MARAAGRARRAGSGELQLTSRTQIQLSDSIVTFGKAVYCWPMPAATSCGGRREGAGSGPWRVDPAASGTLCRTDTTAGGPGRRAGAGAREGSSYANSCTDPRVGAEAAPAARGRPAQRAQGPNAPPAAPARARAADVRQKTDVLGWAPGPGRWRDSGVTAGQTPRPTQIRREKTPGAHPARPQDARERPCGPGRGRAPARRARGRAGRTAGAMR